LAKIKCYYRFGPHSGVQETHKGIVYPHNFVSPNSLVLYHSQKPVEDKKYFQNLIRNTLNGWMPDFLRNLKQV